LVGKRIRYFRGRKDLTQKEFGKLLGFSDSTAEIRIAQYEKERRAPKQDLVNKMAEVLGVNPHALMVPELDTPVGILHTMFAMEDEYGLITKDTRYLPDLDKMLVAYEDKRFLLSIGRLTKEEYDSWRYSFNGEDEECM